MAVKVNDMRAYQRLLSTMSKAAGKGWLPDVTRAVGHEAVARIKACFDRSADPYGKPYEPLVSRNGIPLRDTGRLKNGFLEASTPGKVIVWNMAPYARLQNYGSKGLPGGKVTPVNAKALRFKAFGVTVYSKGVTVSARPFFPDSRGLPAEWSQKLAAVAKEAYAKATRG